MATSIGETSNAVLQNDFGWSWSSQGRRATFNFKGSLAMCQSKQPALGANIADVVSEVSGYPENMIVVSAEIKSVGGGDAILSVVGAYDRREELTWITQEKALENHPAVLDQLTASEIVAVKAAIFSDSKRTDGTTPARTALASGYQKTLYDLLSKRIDSWRLYCPMITITELSVPTYPINPDPGNVIGSAGTLPTTHINAPSSDGLGRSYDYIQSPDVVTVDNGITMTKKVYTGFVGMEQWMYDGTTFPST